MGMDTSVVEGSAFKDMLLRRAKFKSQILELSKEYIQVAYQLIRDCNHPLITVTSSSGLYPHDNNESAVCKSCGLSLNGQSGYPPSAPFINFSQSLIVREINVTRLLSNVEFKMSVETQYAMQYPKRFTPGRLHSLMEDTPFNSAEVLAVDDRRYWVDDAQLINSYDSFKAHYYMD